MFISDKSELSDLSFRSRKPHFSLAKVEWQGWVLNPNENDGPIVDLSDKSLAEVLWDLYGSLTFVECAELHKSIKRTAKLNLDEESYFRRQGFRWDQRTALVMDVTANLDQQFRDWCHDRKLSAQDLMPLTNLKNLEPLNQLSHGFNQLSRSEGKKAMDLLVDLLLMGEPVEALQPQEDWLKQLNQKRYPQTIERDQAKDRHNLPKFAQLQRQRQGDQLQQRLSIQFSDQDDLHSKLRRLGEINL